MNNLVGIYTFTQETSPHLFDDIDYLSCFAYLTRKDKIVLWGISSDKDN